MRKLKLFIAAAALLVSAGMQAKTDVTATYLTDADLSALTGWGNPGKTDWKTDGAVNVVEFWNWSTQFNFSQTAQLPAGYYRLAVNAFYRNSLGGDGTNDNMAWIFAGQKTQNVIALNSMSDLSGYAGSNDLYRAATAFSQGQFSNEFDFNVTGEGTVAVEIGFKGTCPNGGWCILGPVTLWEYTAADYMEDYRAKVAIAQSLLSEKMSPAAIQALNDAIVEESTLNTVDDVLNAVSTLVVAINNANTSIADYANLLTAITNANNHTIYTPVFEASATIYSNAVSTAQGVYDAATVTDCTDAINALTNGIHSAYENDYTVFANDYAYDYSTLLNQDMTQWASTNYVTMTANEHWNGLTGQRYYEQSGAEWGASAWSHAASETATLPVGKYVMSITARASADVTSTMSVKVGDANAITVALPNKGNVGRGITTAGVGSYADGSYSNGNNGGGWEYRFIAFEVTEESPVTISFSSSTNAQYQWVSLAAPLLKGDVHPNQIKLNQAKSLATTLAGYESQISAATYATFADHITAANNATVESTDLDDIITNLQADIATAQDEAAAIAAARASFQTMKDYADALVAVDNDNATANSTLASAISAQATAAEANSVDDINTATSTLKAAMTTYAGAANPVGDGAQFNLTFMLTNPDVTSFWTGAWNVEPDGWYKDQEGGNFQVMNNNSVNATDGIHDIFMEYYYLSGGKTWDNGLFNIYTKATLPAGTYTMSCYAFAKEANYTSDAPNCQVYFYANDTQGSRITTEILAEQSISFVNESEQEVKIGLKPLEGNTYNWMGIGYVELYKVPAQTYTVDEAVAWDNTTEGAGAVTLKRTIKVGVNTLVLPFSMTQDEVESAFGTGSKVYTLKAYNSSSENLSYETHNGISANTPCLLKATEASNGDYTLEGRTIVAGEPTATVSGASMIGTYANVITVPQDDKSFIISNGSIYKVTSAVTLKNTRAYIQLAAATARALTVSFDGGETTGIATLENGELKVETGIIYDLSGRAVKNPAKGIYVINGKKVVK